MKAEELMAWRKNKTEEWPWKIRQWLWVKWIQIHGVVGRLRYGGGAGGELGRGALVSLSVAGVSYLAGGLLEESYGAWINEERKARTLSTALQTIGGAMMASSIVAGVLAVQRAGSNIPPLTSGLVTMRAEQDGKIGWRIAASTLCGAAVCGLSLAADEGRSGYVAGGAVGLMVLWGRWTLRAWRRALALANPLTQIRTFEEAAERWIQRWGMVADRIVRPTRAASRFEEEVIGKGTDWERHGWFRDNPSWDRGVQQLGGDALALADHHMKGGEPRWGEEAMQALGAIVAANVRARGRTFAGDVDNSTREILEGLRRRADRARRDKEEEAFGVWITGLWAVARQLARIEKGHRFEPAHPVGLAVQHLGQQVGWTREWNNADVTIKGLNILGRCARDLVEAGEVSQAAIMMVTIAEETAPTIGKCGMAVACAERGMAELADTTRALLVGTEPTNAGYAMGVAGGQTAKLARVILGEEKTSEWMRGEALRHGYNLIQRCRRWLEAEPEDKEEKRIQERIARNFEAWFARGGLDLARTLEEAAAKPMAVDAEWGVKTMEAIKVARRRSREIVEKQWKEEQKRKGWKED